MIRKEIIWLIRLELQKEWKQRYTLNSILLYVVASIYILSLTLRLFDKPIWNALYWIVLLCAGSGAVSKSFIQESRGKMIFYHQTLSAQGFILAKMVYNAGYMLLVNTLTFLVYSLWLGNLADNAVFFYLSTSLGSVAFSVILSMTSAIAAKTGNANVLMPVLSFPLLIPVLLIAVKTSKKAVDGLDVSLIYPDFLALFAFIIMSGILAFTLYPWLWKD